MNSWERFCFTRSVFNHWRVPFVPGFHETSMKHLIDSESVLWPVQLDSRLFPSLVSYDVVHVALCLAQILLTSRTVFFLKVRFKVMNLSVAPDLWESSLLRQQKAQFCIVVVIAGWSTSSYRQLETVVWQRSPETNRERGEGGARNDIVSSKVYLNPHLNLKQGFPLFLWQTKKKKEYIYIELYTGLYIIYILRF